LSNFDLEKMVDTSDEWIIKRTGISQRRLLDENLPASMMAVEAARRALSNSGFDAADIDLIIVSTTTPDYLTPTTSCIVQKELGARNAAAFDMNAACTGFLYAVTVAKQFVETGYCRYVLVVSCEAMSKVVDYTERKTCVLFGDGAGAVVVGEVEEGYGILSTYMASDGSDGMNITIPCLYMPDTELERRKYYVKKNTVWQDGSEVFKFAVRIMPLAVEKVIENTGICVDDIKYIIPHQANIRIIEGAAKRLRISMDKVYTTIDRYGNISSASIPVALDDALRHNCLKKGDSIVLVGFGGGLTWGSALLKWSC